MIIDADGHTHVSNVVFDDYLDPAFRAKRPRYVELDDGRGVYIIEGRVIIKPSGWGPGTPSASAAAGSRAARLSAWKTSPAAWPISIEKASTCR
jgi:hypothetical protein